MPTFPFRGVDVELIRIDMDNIELDDAEVIEEEVGLDLRDFLVLSKMRQAKIAALISARRVFPDVTLQEVGRVKLRPVIEALAEIAEAETPARPPVELTGTVSIPLAVSDGAPGPSDGEAGEVLSPTSAGSVPSLPA